MPLMPMKFMLIMIHFTGIIMSWRIKIVGRKWSSQCPYDDGDGEDAYENDDCVERRDEVSPENNYVRSLEPCGGWAMILMAIMMTDHDTMTPWLQLCREQKLLECMKKLVSCAPKYLPYAASTKAIKNPLRYLLKVTCATIMKDGTMRGVQ